MIIMEEMKKLNRVLSCVVYSLIENCVCVDYLLCQTFEQASFNISIGICIPELLTNLLSCHGFTRKQNSTVILNLRYRLVKNYLAKGLKIIEKDSEQNILPPNDMKFIIDLIYQMDIDFLMAKKQSNLLCSKPHQKLHIKKNMHLIYKQDYYKEKKMKYMTFLLNNLFLSWKILIILR